MKENIRGDLCAATETPMAVYYYYYIIIASLLFLP